MTEWTFDAALLTLTALVEHVEWYRPIRDAQAEALRASAVYIRDHVDAVPHPSIDELALISVMDALIDWLADPEDETRIARFRAAWDYYSDVYDMVGE